WQRLGLGEARAVVEATADYREDEDELGEFIYHMCWNEGEVERSTLYRAYIHCAESRGNRYLPKQTTFSKRIAERSGIKSRKSGMERYWTGISLREEEACLGNGLRLSLVPHSANNTRFGHLGPQNTSSPQTSSC